jgi:hypothetical protein
LKGKAMIATFNRFDIEMTFTLAKQCSHSGSCYDGVAEALSLPAIRRHVAEALSLPAIRRQLADISDSDLAAVLREYGEWDKSELADRKENEARIVGLAAGNITEEFFGKGKR